MNKAAASGMNKRLNTVPDAMRQSILSCALAVALIQGCRLAAAEASGQSLFPDKNLERAVRKYVFEKRDTDKPLVEADVVNISTIEGKGLGIADLTGLEKCVSLASLDLARNKIKDLSPLKGLSRLQYLDLQSNQVESIAALSNVVALQYIELSHNKVRDLEPLRGLTNLASLYLASNEICRIEPVFGLPKLVSLYVDGNSIRPIAGINQLKSLSTLSLKDNAISDLTPLRGLQGLSWLFLDWNKIRDLGPLVEMVQNDKEQRFAPFLKVYLEGNPLGPDATNQLAALKAAGTRVHTEAAKSASSKE